MKAKILLVSAATALMAAGASQAATSRHSASAYAEPSQPVPYSQLGAYMKASPRARASKDWSAGMNTASAATGTAANTSAMTQDIPGPPSASAQGAVNPPMGQAAPAGSTTSSQPMNSAAPAATDTTQSSTGASNSTGASGASSMTGGSSAAGGSAATGGGAGSATP